MSPRFLLLAVSLTALPATLLADEPPKLKPTSGREVVMKCPVDGNPAKDTIVFDYEGKTYAFCKEDCLKQFRKAREASLYHQVGGNAAISAVIDLFYVKILADDRVKHHFEDVNMRRQHKRQKAFVGAALGGPEPWTGKDLRKAHQNLSLTEGDFGVIAVHLQAALTEKGVKKEHVDKIMAVVASTKDAVLNRPVTKE